MNMQTSVFLTRTPNGEHFTHALCPKCGIMHELQSNLICCQKVFGGCHSMFFLSPYEEDRAHVGKMKISHPAFPDEYYAQGEDGSEIYLDYDRETTEEYIIKFLYIVHTNECPCCYGLVEKNNDFNFIDSPSSKTISKGLYTNSGYQAFFKENYDTLFSQDYRGTKIESYNAAPSNKEIYVDVDCDNYYLCRRPNGKLVAMAFGNYA